MKLWGGPSDTGCCSVADVEDARRVAQQLGIAHHVFNFSEEFDRHVVDPYVADHAVGPDPEPLRRVQPAPQVRPSAGSRASAARLRRGGHRPPRPGGGRAGWHDGPCAAGSDPAKDQSYVLHMLGQDQLARVRLPGRRAHQGRGPPAARPSSGCALRPSPTARTCASSPGSGGREAFLGQRIALRPARSSTRSGAARRRGPGGGAGDHRPAARPGKVGAGRWRRTDRRAGPGGRGGAPPGGVRVDFRRPAPVRGRGRPGSSRHHGRAPGGLACQRGARSGTRSGSTGRPKRASYSKCRSAPTAGRAGRPGPPAGLSTSSSPIRRVAPGQSVVLYRGDAVVGGGQAA